MSRVSAEKSFRQQKFLTLLLKVVVASVDNGPNGVRTTAENEAQFSAKYCNTSYAKAKQVKNTWARGKRSLKVERTKVAFLDNSLLKLVPLSMYGAFTRALEFHTMAKESCCIARKCSYPFLSLLWSWDLEARLKFCECPTSIFGLTDQQTDIHSGSNSFGS